jgi:hypothetical protein
MPGISVVRFSSLPKKEAIFWASSACDPRAWFGFTVGFSFVFFMLRAQSASDEDSLWTATIATDLSLDKRNRQ